MTGFRCPTCKEKFTQVTLTERRVCCPKCGELMFRLPDGKTRAEFKAGLSREWFVDVSYQLADFYPGWNAKKMQERALIADKICTTVYQTLPED
jgi:DNA-directed RNA polymerase subunit RPC12/RpoP